jgi:2-polyprenyl-3-methyl-5-hydroxy-6-metoxy-1,4-benzoquinol methylase
MFFCPSENQIICGNCLQPKYFPIKYWNRSYAYSFECKNCQKNHYDLFYSEFQGIHPYQVNSKLKENFEHWKPVKNRNGKKISFEESYQRKSFLAEFKKKHSNVRYHSDIRSFHQISLNDTKRNWEETSAEFIALINKTAITDEGDINRQLIIDPALWEVIGEVKNLVVLDAGCGNGYLSRKIANKGAIVTGVDISKLLIDYCNKKAKELKLDCTYIQGSLTNLDFLEDNSFDLIVSNIVLIDVIDDLAMFKEFSRILKPEGRLVFSNIHPAFGSFYNHFYRVPKDSKWNEDRLFVMLDDYFKTGGLLMSWGDMKPIWQFDRTLSQISKSLRLSGFIIREITEPVPNKNDIINFPHILAFDADRVPFFIIFDCKKSTAKIKE